MFGIGLPELFIIAVLALVVLGPDKLPDLARAIGKGMSEFRKATDDLKASFQEDDELRELKNNLSQAKDDLTDMVREQTKDIDVGTLKDSIKDGSIFEKMEMDGTEKASDEESPAQVEGAQSPDDGEPESPAATEAAAEPAPSVEEPAAEAPEAEAPATESKDSDSTAKDEPVKS